MFGFSSNKSLDLNQIQTQNVLNSYFGCDSIYKNLRGFPTFGSNSNPISNDFNQQNDWFGFRPINGWERNPNVWNTWPTIEESFGQRVQQQMFCWPTNQSINSFYQLSTNFWNNVNNLSPINGNTGDGLRPPINGFEDQSITAQNMDLLSGNRRLPAPIGTPYEPMDVRDTESTSSIRTVTPEPMPYIQPRMRRRMPSLMECVFCKNNGVSEETYKQHILKDPECRIVCPILRAYDCPICHNGGGDNAHTVRYCPLNKAGVQAKLDRLAKTHINTIHKLNELISGRTGGQPKTEPKRNRFRRKSSQK